MIKATAREWGLVLDCPPEASWSEPARTLVVVPPRAVLLPLRGYCHHIFREPFARGTGLATYVSLAMIRRLAPNAAVTIAVAPQVSYTADAIHAARASTARTPEAVAVFGPPPTADGACRVASERGYLVVASLETLWAVGRVAQPLLLAHLDTLVPLIGGRDERVAIKIIYRSFPELDLVHDVLARVPDQLALTEGIDVVGARSAA
jgi:hypothetical protein